MYDIARLVHLGIPTYLVTGNGLPGVRKQGVCMHLRTSTSTFLVKTAPSPLLPVRDRFGLEALSDAGLQFVVTLLPWHHRRTQSTVACALGQIRPTPVLKFRIPGHFRMPGGLV